MDILSARAALLEKQRWGHKPGCFVFRLKWEGSAWKRHIQILCSRRVAVKGRRDEVLATGKRRNRETDFRWWVVHVVVKFTLDKERSQSP